MHLFKWENENKLVICCQGVDYPSTHQSSFLSFFRQKSERRSNSTCLLTYSLICTSSPYILKARVLVVQTPQIIIRIVGKIIVWERKKTTNSALLNFVTKSKSFKDASKCCEEMPYMSNEHALGFRLQHFWDFFNDLRTFVAKF